MYTIKKGSHHSQNRFGVINGKTFSFKVKFDSTAIYTTEFKENQGDTNKLFGFSDCFSSHHKNSARFGWRWFNQRLELMGYTYAKGVRHYKLLKTIALDKYYDCKIAVKNNKYIFWIDEVKVEMPRGCSGKIFGYQLYPYFGGNEVAPHDINIWIKQ